jgi:hypothetical protein
LFHQNCLRFDHLDKWFFDNNRGIFTFGSSRLLYLFDWLRIWVFVFWTLEENFKFERNLSLLFKLRLVLNEDLPVAVSGLFFLRKD